MDMPRCNTCRHWLDTDTWDHNRALGTRACQAVKMLWDSTQWNEDGDGREWRPNAENATAFVQDGSDYMATLYTKPDHGCTMHEAKSTA